MKEEHSIYGRKKESNDAFILCSVVVGSFCTTDSSKKCTLKIPFKSYGSSTCDLTANQGDISAWCNCNIMRVDKTLLFNTMIFTCHLSLSLRSVNRIDSINSKAQNTNWKKRNLFSGKPNSHW